MADGKPSMDGPTSFIESNALLAVQLDDYEAAEKWLDQLTAHELRGLQVTCRRLADLCGHVERVLRRKAVDHG